MEARTSYTTQLGKVPIFAGLPRSTLTRMVGILEEEEHPRGTQLFAHEDPGDKAYIVLEGRVRISRELSGMGEEALAVLGEGEIFGEMALLDGSRRSADAFVHERCRLLIIPKEAFDRLLGGDRDLACEVLTEFVRVLSNRLREMNNKLTFLSISAKF